MPIRTNLNESPYYDDYDITKQYHRILFRPGYALQARELTQLQTILQNQVEQFGDNIFKEGSIIKGCTFTELPALKYVKVTDTADNILNPGVEITVNQFVGGLDEETGIRTYYEIQGATTGLRALIIQASVGFETNDPDLSTFYITYKNSNDAQVKVFDQGETLEVYKFTIENDVVSAETKVAEFTVTSRPNHVGDSFGIQSAIGIVYQKGHFLYAKDQIVILSKYTNIPDNVSIGYNVRESLITALSDDTLYDNSIGTPNENAPGANRLKLEPILVAIPTTVADGDPTFFTLARYANGAAIQVRDVSQYNVLGEEMARRTYEESGNYIVKGFKTKIATAANNAIQAILEPGLAYVKGYRVENKGEIAVTIDQLDESDVEAQTNQSVVFNYGSYVEIANTSLLGTLPVGTYQTANLKNIGGTTIGTAMVRNFTPSRVYLSNIRMGANNFSDVVSIDGAAGSVKINPVIKQKSNDTLIFNIGETFLNTVSDISLPVRKARAISNIADSFTLTALSGEDFNVPIDSNNTLIVDSTQDNLQISSIVRDSSTQLTINLVPGQTPSASGTIYYNSRITTANPHSKLDRTLYVKNTFTPGTTKYSLGFPDVYQLISVIDSSNTDVTNSFRLKENQQDHYYDISYIEYISGRPVPASGLMTITVKAFKLNAIGSYFFTVDSYPASLDLSYIPTYKTSSGVTLNLRDCLDFRPYAANTVAYASAEVSGTAPTVSTAVGTSPTFSGTFLIPALESAATLDYEYYLNRTDIVTIDSYGKFALTRGKPARKSRATEVSNDKLVVAEIYIPGYPAISPLRASQENKPELAIRSKILGTKNYTMKDIQDIDDKINKLIYYTSLSLLETKTKQLTITDENGLDRFKNGILVDPFDDLTIADARNTEFNAAIDFTEKSLTPAVRTIPLNLKYKTGTNITLHPSTDKIDIATLATSTNIPFITQPYATNTRNCVSDFYNFIGRGFLYPEYDGAFDTVKAPDINVDIDLATPIAEFSDAIQEFIPLTSTRSRLISTSSNRVISGTQETSVFEDTIRSVVVSKTKQIEQDVGDFVTNITFNPYIRSREINVLMYGLRPNTRHYFFFDEVDVNEFVKPGLVPSTDSIRDVVPAGAAGAAVTSNANGVLAAVFKIPSDTFFVGDKVLTVTDVDSIFDIETSSTSGGNLVYRAYNFSATRQGLTISTRAPKTEVTQNSSNRNVAGRFIPDPPPPSSFDSPVNIGSRGSDGPTNVIGRNGEVYATRQEALTWGGGVKGTTSSSVTSSRNKSIEGGSNFGKNTSVSGPVSRSSSSSKYSGKDPLAQTFFIKSGMTQGDDCLFASRVDVFFKRKSTSNNGVTLMLREVENGYPSREILPFSEVHLPASQVLVSDDSSIATSFFFSAPVRLDAEKEYCIVIMPDADDPDYLVFTSKTGLNDFITKAPISSDWGDGMLFTSTNNRTWQSYQDEDLKFTLYRRDFNIPAGAVTLTNEDNEFLTLTNINGDFESGELVYTLKERAGGTSNTVTVSSGNTQVSGSGLSSTYAVNDYIYIYNDLNTVFDIFKIKNVTSTTLTVDKPVLFSGEYNAKPAVVGNIIYYNYRSPEIMHLEKSSATVSKFFAATDVITGINSGAFATILSVDNIELSYIQPIISRTNSRATEVSIIGEFTDPIDTGTSYKKEMLFNDKTVFNEKGCIVFSKSNGDKPFDIELRLNNKSNTTVTPFIDVETATLLAYQYKIGANTDITSSYVSKTVELAENLDAEDFILYATAYKPVNTEINIYLKVQHASDPLAFELNDWIKLEEVNGNQNYSSLSNINDFKEFTYKLPDTEKVGGVLTYNNSSGTYSGYRKFAVKIEFIATESAGRIAIGSVPRLLDYRGIAIT